MISIAQLANFSTQFYIKVNPTINVTTMTQVCQADSTRVMLILSGSTGLGTGVAIPARYNGPDQNWPMNLLYLYSNPVLAIPSFHLVASPDFRFKLSVKNSFNLCQRAWWATSAPMGMGFNVTEVLYNGEVCLPSKTEQQTIDDNYNF